MPEGAAVVVGHHGHVEPGLLHGQERVVERGRARPARACGGPARAGSGRCRAAPDRVSRSLAWTKPRTSSTSSPATSSRVWPDATTSGLGLGRRGRARQPHDAVARHHHRGDAAIAEVERAGEQLVGDLLDEPLVARRAQHHGELVGRRGGGQLVARLDAEQAHARRSTSALSTRSTGPNTVT